MAARHKDTGAGSSEAPAGQIWDESNIYMAKDSGEGEKPTETGRGGGLPGTAVAPALRLDTQHFAAAEKAWFQKAFQLGGSLILRRSRRPAWPEHGSPGVFTGHQAKQRTRSVGPAGRVSAGDGRRASNQRPMAPCATGRGAPGTAARPRHRAPAGDAQAESHREDAPGKACQEVDGWRPSKMSAPGAGRAPD